MKQQSNERIAKSKANGSKSSKNKWSDAKAG
jgi:hypothetical protein